MNFLNDKHRTEVINTKLKTMFHDLAFTLCITASMVINSMILLLQLLFFRSSLLLQVRHNLFQSDRRKQMQNLP